jgi:hypothetical protein
VNSKTFLFFPKFFTGFETSEGYVTGEALAGQNGWVISGAGSNGVVNGYFSGQGNQAYIGYSAPPGTVSEGLYQPIDYTPVSGDVIQFSAQMDIHDSTGGLGSPRDTFRWSVYNISGVRLFSIAFNNATNAVTYVLDNGTIYSNASGVTPQPAGVRFQLRSQGDRRGGASGEPHSQRLSHFDLYR